MTLMFWHNYTGVAVCPLPIYFYFQYRSFLMFHQKSHNFVKFCLFWCSKKRDTDCLTAQPCKTLFPLYHYSQTPVRPLNCLLLVDHHWSTLQTSKNTKLRGSFNHEEEEVWSYHPRHIWASLATFRISNLV